MHALLPSKGKFLVFNILQNMAAFLENPLFLFVDETEPILPIFRSSEYSDSRKKIVELADVGCDTETTFLTHFLHGKFNRRRGGVEGIESARRITKELNERPTNFSAHIPTNLNDFEDKKEKYIKNKSWRNNRNDVYTADLDYNSCSDDSYDDREFLNNIPRYNDYRTDFVRPQNVTEKFWRERPSQNIRYSRNYEIPFLQNNRVSRERNKRPYYQRKNTCPLWFANDDKRNVYETRNIDGRSRRSSLNEHRKRMRIFQKDYNNFDRDAEGRRSRIRPKRREQDVSFDYVNSVRPSENDCWDFTLLENEPNYKESTFLNWSIMNNHGHLWETMSQNFDSQLTCVDVTDSENDEFTKTHEKSNFVNSPSLKNSIKGARCQISKNGATVEKLKTDTSIPRVQSTGISIERRLSNVCSMEEVARLCSTIEEKKNNTSYATPTDRRKEIANSSSARGQIDSRRWHDNFDNVQVRICNEPLNETGQFKNTSMFPATARSNKRTYRENNVNFCVESSNKNGEIDRADQTVSSQFAPKEVTKNEEVSTLELPFTSPCAEVKKRKISRLPVRTWKRLRTRGPGMLHLESKITSKVVNAKLPDVDITFENVQLNKLSLAEDDKKREEITRDCASRHGDLKPNNCYRTGKPSVTNKMGSVLDNPKDLKGIKSLNTSKRTQRTAKEEDELAK